MPTPSWRTQGQEPDYRFTLANERTFLAWIRTALSLLAAGVLLAQFATRLSPAWVVAVVGAMLAATAAVLGAAAYGQWRANEIAMRNARPMPHTPLVSLCATVILFVAAVLGVMLVWR